MQGAKDDVSAWVLDPDEAAIKPKTVDVQQRSTLASVSARLAPGGFATYHLQHSGMLQTSAVVGAGSVPGVSDFLQNTVLPAVEALVADLRTDFDDLSALCSDPSHTLADAHKLIVDLADTLIDPVAAIADGMFAFVEDMLVLLKSGLEDELKIPFLTEFYEFLTDFLGDEEDFTVINGLALLVAIPLVEVWKAAEGEAPFADGSRGLDSPTLFQGLGGGDTVAQPARLQALLQVQAAGAEEPPAAAPSVSQIQKDYSRLGGAIAAVAGGAGAICEMIMWASYATQEQAPGDEGALSTADKIGIGLGAVKFATTFPVPVDRSSNAWILRMTSWVIGGAQVIITPFLKKPPLLGGVNAALDGVFLILTAVADGLDSPGVMGWAADIVSNGSGVVRDIGAAVEEPVSITMGVGFGVIGGLLGIGYVATEHPEDGIYYLINAGG